MALGLEVGLGPVHIVLDEDTALLSKQGQSPPPNFWPIYCGQTAGCIKMPLGTEVGLDLRDIAFEVDPATRRKRAHPPPIFGPCLLWPMAGWMKMPLGTEVDLGPGHIVLDGCCDCIRLLMKLSSQVFL